MVALPAFSADQAACHGVWMADEIASAQAAVAPTGHAALDAELPGAGWPLGALIEVLQPAPQGSVWPLLLPALARQAQQGRVALIQPPHEPFVPALVAAGMPWSQTLWIQGATPAQAAWAGEQALRCQDVAAVVAWLPRAQAADLRRLHQAAASTGALLFVLRPAHAAQVASPARVRLRVTAALPPLSWPRLRLVGAGSAPAAAPRAAWPQLRVDLLKRRGPPLAQPLWLPAAGDAVLSVARAAQGDGVDRADDLRPAPLPHTRVMNEALGGARPAAAPTVHRLLPRRASGQRPPPGPRLGSPQEDGHALAGIAVAVA